MRIRWTSVWMLAGALPTAFASENPELFPSQIVNAADHRSGPVAPGETIMLYPAHAGPPALTRLQMTADGRVSSYIGETRVLFDGIAAPLGYVAPGQICAVVPYAIAGRRQTQVVVEYQGVKSTPVVLPVVASRPAAYTFDLSGSGQAAMLNETGCCVSPRNPAMRGAIVALYATGEGQTRPAGIDGKLASPPIRGIPVPRLPVRIRVGGVPAQIVWVGEAPQIIGSLQINFRVPAAAPLGDAVPLLLEIGGARALDGVTMAVRSRTRTVLIVDGDATPARQLRAILQGSGYRVLTADSTGEARAQAQTALVDLIVSSLHEADPERAQWIHEMLSAQPGLKVMASAERLDAETLRQADLLGAQAILRRPYDQVTVGREIQRMVRSRPTPYGATEKAPRLPISGPAN